MGTKFPLFLNAAQRAHYSKRRKEIWEALHPEPMAGYGREDGGDGDLEVGQAVPPQVYGHGGARPQTKSFAAETAAITGQSKRDINRSVARAEAIGDDLLRLTGTSLDKGVELDALAKLPEPERKDLIERATLGEAVTAQTNEQTNERIKKRMNTLPKVDKRLPCLLRAQAGSRIIDVPSATAGPPLP